MKLEMISLPKKIFYLRQSDVINIISKLKRKGTNIIIYEPTLKKDTF